MPEYYYEDEGAPIQQRTSTRHYQPTQQRVRRTTEAYDDYDYYDEPITPVRRSRTTESHPPVRSSVPSRATGQVRRQPPQQYVEPPVQRQRVYQPPAQQSRRPVEPEAPKKVSRRSFLGITKKRAAIGLGFVGGGTLAYRWTTAQIAYQSGHYQQGDARATNRSLVCGHHDDPAHQTQLHACIQDNGIIMFTEVPGGNPQKYPARNFFTASVFELGYTGSLSELYLEIITDLVDAAKNKYQIRLVLVHHPAGASLLWSQPFQSHEWMLVDNGKGYFDGVMAPKK